MSIEKTQALVLKKQDLRETSILATFFTKDHGKINGLIKGARGNLNCTFNALELFSLSEIVFYKKRRGNIYTVSQCDLIEYFKDIRRDYSRIIYATYFVDLLNAVTSYEDESQQLFDLINKTLSVLNRPANPEAIKNIFEIKTLSLSGFKPRLDACIRCTKPIFNKAKFSTRFGGLICQNCFGDDKNSLDIYEGTVASMLHIEKADFNNVWRLNPTQKVKRQLDKILNDFIRFHIDKYISSKVFMESFT